MQKELEGVDSDDDEGSHDGSRAPGKRHHRRKALLLSKAARYPVQNKHGQFVRLVERVDPITGRTALHPDSRCPVFDSVVIPEEEITLPLPPPPASQPAAAAAPELLPATPSTNAAAAPESAGVDDETADDDNEDEAAGDLIGDLSALSLSAGLGDSVQQAAVEASEANEPAAWTEALAAIPASRIPQPAKGDSFLAWLLKREKLRLAELTTSHYHHSVPTSEHCVLDLSLRDKIYSGALTRQLRGVNDTDAPSASTNGAAAAASSSIANAGGLRFAGSNRSGSGGLSRWHRDRGPASDDGSDARAQSRLSEVQLQCDAVVAMLRSRGLATSILSSLIGGDLIQPWSFQTSKEAEEMCADEGVGGKLPISDRPDGYLSVDFGAAIPSLDAYGRWTGMQLRAIDPQVTVNGRQVRSSNRKYKDAALPRFYTFGSHRPSSLVRDFTPLHTLPYGDEPLACWIPKADVMRASGCLLSPPAAGSGSCGRASLSGDGPSSIKPYRIAITEGALKPAIAAAFLGQPAIGGWGGDFKTCRALFRYLAAIARYVFGLSNPVVAGTNCRVTVEIYPDAGICDNSDAAFKIMSVTAALTRAGYAVNVMFWNQFLKADKLEKALQEEGRRRQALRRLQPSQLFRRSPLATAPSQAGSSIAAEPTGTGGSISSSNDDDGVGLSSLLRWLLELRNGTAGQRENFEAYRSFATCDIDDLLAHPRKGLRARIAAVAAASAGSAASQQSTDDNEPDVAELRHMARNLLVPLSLQQFYEGVVSAGQLAAVASASAGNRESSGEGGDTSGSGASSTSTAAAGGRPQDRTAGDDILRRCRERFLKAQRTLLERLADVRGLHLVTRRHRPPPPSAAAGGSSKRRGKTSRLELHFSLTAAAGRGGAGDAKDAHRSANGGEGPAPAAGDRDGFERPPLRYVPGTNGRIAEREGVGRYWVMLDTDVNPLTAAPFLSLNPLASKAASSSSNYSAGTVTGVPPHHLSPIDLRRYLYPFRWEQPLPLQPQSLLRLDAMAQRQHLQAAAAKGRGPFDGSLLQWRTPDGADRLSWEFAYLAECWNDVVREKQLPPGSRVEELDPSSAAASLHHFDQKPFTAAALEFELEVHCCYHFTDDKELEEVALFGDEVAAVRQAGSSSTGNNTDFSSGVLSSDAATGGQPQDAASLMPTAAGDHASSSSRRRPSSPPPIPPVPPSLRSTVTAAWRALLRSDGTAQRWEAELHDKSQDEVAAILLSLGRNVDGTLSSVSLPPAPLLTAIRGLAAFMRDPQALADMGLQVPVPVVQPARARPPAPAR